MNAANLTPPIVGHCPVRQSLNGRNAVRGIDKEAKNILKLGVDC